MFDLSTEGIWYSVASPINGTFLNNSTLLTSVIFKLFSIPFLSNMKRSSNTNPITEIVFSFFVSLV